MFTMRRKEYFKGWKPFKTDLGKWHILPYDFEDLTLEQQRECFVNGDPSTITLIWYEILHAARWYGAFLSRKRQKGILFEDFEHAALETFLKGLRKVLRFVPRPEALHMGQEIKIHLVGTKEELIDWHRQKKGQLPPGTPSAMWLPSL